MAINDKEYYSVKQFARKIGLHPNTVRESIKNGTINAFRVGENTSKYIIPYTEITRLSYKTK